GEPQAVPPRCGGGRDVDLHGARVLVPERVPASTNADDAQFVVRRDDVADGIRVAALLEADDVEVRFEATAEVPGDRAAAGLEPHLEGDDVAGVGSGAREPDGLGSRR